MRISPEKSVEDNILDAYDSFLDDIENFIWEKISDAIKMKNISNYKMLMKLNDDKQLAEELSKKFEVIKRARFWFIKEATIEMKKKIQTNEVYLVPLFVSIEENLNIRELFFVKKKDKIDSLKERIKKLLDSFIPEPEPWFHH